MYFYVLNWHKNKWGYEIKLIIFQIFGIANTIALVSFPNKLFKYLTPDILCLTYGTCKIDPGRQFCHLFPVSLNINDTLQTISDLKTKHNLIDVEIDVCKFPIIKDICNILNNSYSTLQPAEDFDSDGFSLISTTRGTDWKGKDCGDYSANIYPGRKPYNEDVRYDSNCNGIWGSDPGTGKPWETILCSDSKPRGIIAIGDSVTAHFHVPEVWLNPTVFQIPRINSTAVLLDELDWPHLSFLTGFKNVSENILIQGFTDSIYLKLKHRNRCNHRDYQNIGRNGDSSYNGQIHADGVVRNQSNDNPAIVFYAMIGNDVCNNMADTLAHMTTPKMFRKNLLKVLYSLNNKLPKSSHVILIGLVDASFIYDVMAEKIHPIGVLHQNVHYKSMYQWLNCLQIGPCTGWLNSNETLRRLTSEKAEKLSTVLKTVARTKTYKHFTLHYLENPVNILKRTTNISLDLLLEAADSFHPNQRAQPLLANTLWKSMKKYLTADVVGPVNLKNNLIKKIFGDQGGY